MSFVVDSTNTLSYDLVLENPTYQDYSVAEGTVDIKPIDVSANTVFAHDNSALTQTTTGIGATGTATITYAGPGSLNTINNKLKVVVYETSVSPVSGATDTD